MQFKFPLKIYILYRYNLIYMKNIKHLKYSWYCDFSVPMEPWTGLCMASKQEP